MIPGLDTVRLAAALAVMWGHAWPIHGDGAGWGLGLERWGVGAFFVLSGYLVTQSWRRDPHAGRFAARRFLRLWPGLAGAVAFTLSLAWLTGGVLDLGYLRWLAFWPQLVVEGAFSGNPGAGYANTSLWTITLEVLCYGAVVCLGSFRAWKLTALAAITTLAMIGGGPILTLVALFAAGVWLAVMGVKVALPWPDPPADVSYGVYLYAFPCQQLAVWLASDAGAMGCLALALVPTLALAWASWVWIERPALRLKAWCCISDTGVTYRPHGYLDARRSRPSAASSAASIDR